MDLLQLLGLDKEENKDPMAESFHGATGNVQSDAGEPIELPGPMGLPEDTMGVDPLANSFHAEPGSNPRSIAAAPAMPDPMMADLANKDKSLFDMISGKTAEHNQKGNVGLPSDSEASKLAGKSSSSRGIAKSKSLMEHLIPSAAASDVVPAKKATDPYGEDLNDAALKAAQDHKTKMNMWTNIGRGTNQMLGGATNTKVSNDVMDAVDKDGDQFEKDILTRRGGKDKETERQSKLIKLELEQEKGDANSFVSKTYREIAQKLKPGLNIPEGVTANQLESVLPVLKSLAQKEMDEYQRVRLAQAWKRLDQGEQNYGLRERTQGWKEKEKDELSDAQTKEVIALDKTMGGLDDIAELKPAFNTGPIAGRVAAFQKTVGMDEAKRTAFKQKVGRQLATYIKEISGTAASDTERAFLTGLLPNENLSDAAFLESIATFKKELANSRSRLLEGYRRQGKAGGAAAMAAGPNMGYKGELDKTQKKTDPSSDPRVDQFMKSNGITDRNEAIKILKDNGKI